MSYPADPGGNFASDVHRRTLAHLSVPGGDPTNVETLVERMAPDASTDLDEAEAVEVLEDLEADGDASQSEDGWKQTKAGHKVLTGPIATDGGRAHGEQE